VIPELANACRWRGRPGHYEGWHLHLVDPTSAASVWIRYSFLSPEDAGVGRVAELWLAGGLAGGERFARRQTYAIEEFSTGAAGFPVELAGSTLELGRAAGAMADAAWRLEWQPAASAVANRAAQRIGRSQVLSAQPALRATGEVTVGSHRLAVRAWPGHQAHAWGERHADRWARAHCAAFPDADEFLDVATRSSPTLAGLSPPVTTAAVRFGGVEHHSAGALRGLAHEADFGPDGYEFEVRGARMRLTGKVRAHADSLIGVTYQDPDGDRVYCYHTERADLHARVLRRSVRGWRAAAEIDAGGCCGYEYAQRAAVPGLEVVL
jgi:hypothetical protein